MSDTIEHQDLSEWTESSRQTPVEGHDAFVRSKVQKALKAREDGTATYKSLDEIAAKYDL